MAEERQAALNAALKKNRKKTSAKVPLCGWVRLQIRTSRRCQAVH